MTRLLKQLWEDDCGAILTTEYLTLGSIVALGSAAGLTSIKDAMVEECREHGQAIRDVNQAHRPVYRGQASRTADGRMTFDRQHHDGDRVFMTP
jgi:hypothetical protein